MTHADSPLPFSKFLSAGLRSGPDFSRARFLSLEKDCGSRAVGRLRPLRHHAPLNRGRFDRLFFRLCLEPLLVDSPISCQFQYLSMLSPRLRYMQVRFSAFSDDRVVSRAVLSPLSDLILSRLCVDCSAKLVVIQVRGFPLLACARHSARPR